MKSEKKQAGLERENRGKRPDLGKKEWRRGGEWLSLELWTCGLWLHAGINLLRQRNRWAHTAVSVYVCVCFHTSCLLEHYLFIYLLALEVNVENSLFDQISYHRKSLCDSVTLREKTNKHPLTNTPAHPHTSMPQHLLMHTNSLAHPHTCTHLPTHTEATVC